MAVEKRLGNLEQGLGRERGYGWELSPEEWVELLRDVVQIRIRRTKKVTRENISWKAKVETFEEPIKRVCLKRAWDASEVRSDRVLRMKLMFQEMSCREVRRKEEPKDGRVHTKLPELYRSKSW